MNGTPGVLGNFPEDLRSRRSGPITQKVVISDDGCLTIRISFFCSQNFDDKNKQKVKAESVKRFYLQDFTKNSEKKFDVNRHLNTMSFYDHTASWTLSFRSLAELDKAYKLFSTLLGSVTENRNAKVVLPSHLAKEAGYKYVVAAPRSQTVEEGGHLLTFPEQSPRLLVWLTKKDVKDRAILEEAVNASPLYVYELSILDQSPFCTVFNPAVTSFFPCTLEGEGLQSVFSDNPDELQHYLEHAPVVGVRFRKLPTLSAPVAIIVTGQQKRSIQKRWDVPLLEETPFFYDEEIPQGTTSSWLTGVSDTSDDVCRYLFSRGQLDRFSVKNILFREYPNLEKLLKVKGRLRKDASLEDFIYMKESMLEASDGAFTPQEKIVLRVALFSHELGTPFGPDDQLAYNSYPIALCLAEKLGFKEREKRMLRALIETPMVVLPKEKDEALLQEFVHAAFTAQELGMSIGDWLKLQRFYLQLIMSQIPPNTTIKNEDARLRAVQERYNLLMPFGLTFGVRAMQGPLSTRSLFSSYIWEARDPSHRDGLSLKRRREKYEHMLVDNPHSPWKGRFWEWLDNDMKKKPFPPNKYFTPEERRPYEASFEDGKLVSPKISEGNVEMMFVVDSWGRIYVGEKKEGSGKDDPGMNHASFLGAGEVASAGKITFHARRPVHITDHTGHYRSGPKEIVTIVSELEKKGVDLSGLEVEVGSGNHRKNQLWPSGGEFLKSQR